MQMCTKFTDLPDMVFENELWLAHTGKRNDMEVVYSSLSVFLSLHQEGLHRFLHTVYGMTDYLHDTLQ